MPTFSKAFINQVKANVSMVELARQYTDLSPVGSGVYSGKCPHPAHDDSSPSFRVYQEKNQWCCFGCHTGSKGHGNFGSDVIAFIQWIENLSWTNAIIHLAEIAGIPIEEDKHAHLYQEQKMLAMSYYSNLTKQAKNYLYQRGLTDKTIKTFHIGFDGSTITFPLQNRYKQFIGFSKRQYLSTDGPKYKNSRSSDIFHKGSFLFGLDKLDNSFPEVRITEGAMDMILPYQYGAKNVVATLGTAFTNHHVDLIKNLKMTPVFCMDNDMAGQKSMRKSIQMLAEEGVYSKVLLLPSEYDLADLAKEQGDNIENYISSHSVSYAYYLTKDLLAQYDQKIMELQFEFLPAINQALASIHSNEEKAVVQSMIYKKTGIEMESFA